MHRDLIGIHQKEESLQKEAPGNINQAELGEWVVNAASIPLP
jgi:hypothetical protein